jgi:hypothetical protein
MIAVPRRFLAMVMTVFAAEERYAITMVDRP